MILQMIIFLLILVKGIVNSKRELYFIIIPQKTCLSERLIATSH